MATPSGTAPDPLSVLGALEADPHRHDFFLALRRLESAYHDRPRFGTSRHLKDDPIRFTQSPSMAFAPSTLSALLPSDTRHRPRLVVNFFGLLGPNGPLPLHLTEHARDRLRNAGDPTFVRFLDVFHHRLLSLFYRAWADAQPTVSLDRPEHDAFGRFVASLCGYGMPTLRNRDAVPDYAKLAGVNALARQARSAEGLSNLLSAFFRVPVAIEAFRPHWMPLPADAQTRLGRHANARLGLTAVAGKQVWDVQSRFRVRLGPLSLADFERFLPGTPSHLRLGDWIKNYVGHELSWEASVVLKRQAVPPALLGRNVRLGWVSWLGERRARHDADDLVLDAEKH